jgi:hypothetical protein
MRCVLVFSTCLVICSAMLMYWCAPLCSSSQLSAVVRHSHRPQLIWLPWTLAVRGPWIRWKEKSSGEAHHNRVNPHPPCSLAMYSPTAFSQPAAAAPMPLRCDYNNYCISAMRKTGRWWWLLEWVRAGAWDSLTRKLGYTVCVNHSVQDAIATMDSCTGAERRCGGKKRPSFVSPPKKVSWLNWFPP